MIHLGGVGAEEGRVGEDSGDGLRVADGGGQAGEAGVDVGADTDEEGSGIFKVGHCMKSFYQSTPAPLVRFAINRYGGDSVGSGPASSSYRVRTGPDHRTVRLSGAIRMTCQV